MSEDDLARSDMHSAAAVIGLQARYRKSKVAVDDLVRPVTYGELWETATVFAADLSRLGVQRGNAVVLALEPSADYVAALLGTMVYGAVAVPLNTRLTAAEVGEFVAPVGPAAIVASPSFADLLAALLPSRARRLALGKNEVVVGTPSSAPHLLGRNAALVLGTGGTTGTPKGALFSHAALWRWVIACAANNHVRSDDVEMYVAPFFHGTLVTGLLTTLSQGASAVLFERFDAEHAAAEIGRGAVTRMLGAATVVERLARAAQTMDMSRMSLRRLQFGMSATRQGFANDLRSTFPGVVVITGYGATEFGPVTRTYSFEFGEDGDPVGVGHPVPGASILIEAGGELHTDPEVEGEILVQAPWQMSGYCGWGPERSEEVIRDGHIRSGDIGRFDENGNLLITGRAKDTIRTGGETVYPAEVEAALYRNGAVSECAVFGVADPDWGERVEAAVVTKEPLDAGILQAELRKMLAGYKVPKRIRFMDALPQTTASKVDRRALRSAAETAEQPL